MPVKQNDNLSQQECGKAMQIFNFCRMFFKTETNETLDSSIKTMFIKLKKGTKHTEAYS